MCYQNVLDLPKNFLPLHQHLTVENKWDEQGFALEGVEPRFIDGGCTIGLRGAVLRLSFSISVADH